MLSSGLPVDLPLATTTVTVNDAGQHIVISITKDGRWAVEQEPATEDDLIDLLNVEFAKATEAKTILIKGDRDLEYGAVREVMDILADYNMTTIMIAANKE
jgi:biopolymer transport protein ExbD